MTTLRTLRNRTNRALTPFNRNYFDAIPLSDVFNTVENIMGGRIVQGDGTPWSGLLLGEDGRAQFQISGFRTASLYMSWHKMESGRYEIVTYVS